MSGKTRRMIRALVVAVAVVLVAGVVATKLIDDDAPSTSDACAAWDAANASPALVPPPVSDPVPVDPGVRIGVLANGLTYYVRANDRPGGSAHFRLAVNAGSALEDPDQSGVAHFVEHMMFNGTEQFPGIELQHVLAELGVEFGADLNATTTYDETVYRLDVLNRDEDMATALDVLAEWADRASIAPEEVEAERGVIVEELRLRNQTSDGRLFQHAENLLLGGSPYADRSPGGLTDAVQSVTPEVLRRFYEDWYRPDLMAVVAVGDFDVDEIEAEIVVRFDPLPTAAPGSRVHPQPVIGAATAPRVDAYADGELARAEADLFFPSAGVATPTTGSLRAEVARELAFDVLSRRLAEDATHDGSAFYDATSETFPVVRRVDTPVLTLKADPEKLDGAVQGALTEVVRARRHGFTDAEIAAAVAARRRAADNERQGAATVQNEVYGETYAEHFLSGKPIPSPDDRHALEIGTLDTITRDEVERAFRDSTQCGDLAVLAAGPDDYADHLPDTDEVTRAVSATAAATLEPRPPPAAVPPALMSAPEPAEVTSRQRADLYREGGELAFANGVRVILNPTAVSDDIVLLGAVSPGGLAAVPEGEVANARAAPALVGASGLAGLDRAVLDELVSARVVELEPYIDETTEGFDGSSSTGDLEVLLQLVHLTMTQPRVDPFALAAYKGENRIVAEDPSRVPEAAVDSALDDARFGASVYYRTVPNTDDLASIDQQRALAAFQTRFADATDFVFVLAGDFDVDAATDLAQRYLGTLPTAGRVDTVPDLRPDPPPELLVRTVNSGVEQQASLTIEMDAPITPDPHVRAQASLAEALLDDMIRARLREQLGAIYTAFTKVEVRDVPDAGVETRIEITTDPNRIDEVAAEVVAIVDGLRTTGPDAGPFDRVVQQLSTNAQFYSNEQVLEEWFFYAIRPDQDAGDVLRLGDRLQDATAADVAAFAQAAFPLERRIEIRRVPAS